VCTGDPAQVRHFTARGALPALLEALDGSPRRRGGGGGGGAIVNLGGGGGGGVYSSGTVRAITAAVRSLGWSEHTRAELVRDKPLRRTAGPRGGGGGGSASTSAESQRGREAERQRLSPVRGVRGRSICRPDSSALAVGWLLCIGARTAPRQAQAQVAPVVATLRRHSGCGRGASPPAQATQRAVEAAARQLLEMCVAKDASAHLGGAVSCEIDYQSDAPRHVVIGWLWGPLGRTATCGRPNFTLFEARCLRAGVHGASMQPAGRLGGLRGGGGAAAAGGVAAVRRAGAGAARRAEPGALLGGRGLW
jgi:hypothetical protein